jgi:prepilin peptidase CpaA
LTNFTPAVLSIPNRQSGYFPPMNAAHLWDSQSFYILIKIIYAAALSYGCICDIKSLKIPNAVSVIVLALFFLNWWVAAPADDLTKHLIVAGAALFLGFGIYVAGFMGAGDIKLITVLMLWAGTRDGFAFLIAMTLIGGVFASLLLISRKSMAVWPSTQDYIPSRRLRMWAQRGIFPYGIAICTAGLLLMPSFFAAH